VPKLKAFCEFNNIFMENFQMKRILGIGNALVDIMTLIESDFILREFNLPKGSMQLVDSKKSEQIKEATKMFPRTWSSGGSAANTLHGLAMLGADTGFIGSIGNDVTGDFFENDMKKAGVNTTLIRRNLATGTALALITSDSERTFATHLGAAVELTAKDLNPVMFDDYDILYLEGYLISDFQFTETACRLAKDKGLTVALDLASYNIVETYLESYKIIINSYVDILFANENESKQLTGEDPEKALPLLADMADIVILKTGASGSWVKSKDELVRINAFPANCIDTTGAGDLYASGFLFGYANNLNLESCGMIGSFLAGKVIEIVGARIENEKFAEILKEINHISHNKNAI
jgi:sugar/nucleoside kinase (ribokinase family)